MATALDAIVDNARVYFPSGSGVPLSLLNAMVEERHRWTSLEVVTEYLVEPIPLFDHPNEPFRLLSLQPSRATAAMAEAGAMDVVPSSLLQWGDLLARNGPIPIDVAVIHVSPPGPDGRFSLGVSVATPIEVMAEAPIVIAQVNPQMPYTFGAGEIERDEVDFFVEGDHPLVEMPPPLIDDTTRKIAARVIDLIPDGSILQFGIGALPEAVLGSLSSRQNLGIHSGMLGDSAVTLHASGAINGSTKRLWPGKITVGLGFGTRPLFDFMHRNPEIIMLPASLTHGSEILKQMKGLVAINSAIEIALDGSVNAEMAGNRLLSGPGGQPDYAIAVSQSPGSRSVIALPSTAAGGKSSRIVRQLAAGATVTVPRYLIDTVVTEHGLAELWGRSLRQRAEALRAIADPSFREALG